MKTVIIRLKDNSISEKHSDECIEQAKKFNVYPEKFDGINGLTYKDHLEKLNIRPLKKFKKGLPGIYGCFLSHYYIWKDCVKSNVPYFILEHDGFLIKSLPEDILDHFEDILRLDSENPYDPDYENILKLKENQTLEYNKILKTDSDNGAGWYAGGTYAYIIKPHAAKKLLDWIDINGFLPSDQQLGLNVIVMHQCIPSLARIHPFYTKDNNIITQSTTWNKELL
jgi:GR25 family glycosyltransferase involved in LPS biosynthesis